jgi:hypothetical protein
MSYCKAHNVESSRCVECELDEKDLLLTRAHEVFGAECDKFAEQITERDTLIVELRNEIKQLTEVEVNDG